MKKLQVIIKVSAKVKAPLTELLALNDKTFTSIQHIIKMYQFIKLKFNKSII